MPKPPRDFSLTVSPSSAAITAGQQATYHVTVTPIRNFSGTVSFSSNLPASFNPATITRNGTTNATVTTTQAFPGGSFTVMFSGSVNGIIMHNTQAVLNVTAYVPPVPTPYISMEVPMRSRGFNYQRSRFVKNVIAVKVKV